MATGSSNECPDCITQLLASPDDEFLKASSVLLKIVRNILSNPSVEKYRSIQVGSRTFMEFLLPVDGAIQCLYEIGFVEQDDRLVCMIDDVYRLSSMKSHLENAVQTKKIPTATRPSSGNILISEAEMYQKLRSHFEHSLIYENRSLQQKACSIIPTETLQKKAKDRQSLSPEFSNNKGSIALDFDDCLLLELLHWFKHEFFTWTDAPECPTCFTGKPVSIGMLPSTTEELKWGAHRVEGYRCNQCHDTLRFPRYNNPEKLLETRTGRCGEWANCFTLLCRALDFDARHVLDWTDHVWTEVYSKSAKRWLHCDPCENTCDKPLIYEQGWGKKLSFIVAASCDEIVDVTWRYTNKFEEVLTRRGVVCREDWFWGKLSEMQKLRKSRLSASQRELVEKRWTRELVEFISPKSVSKNNYSGRTTGSLDWRSARRELGETPFETTEVIIAPSSKEYDAKLIQLEYFSSPDYYIRKFHANIKGWRSLAHNFKNIERKVENDWEMAYLARASTTKAHISWKIDIGKNLAALVIKRVTVMIKSTVFQSGVVKLLMCTEKSCSPVVNNKRNVFTEEVSGSRSFTLHAFLSGGDGESAWQHTQLFRESLNSSDSGPQMEIVVELYKKE